MAKASDNEFPKIIGSEQASDPVAPGAGTRKLYAKADGWYDEDSTGAVTGPLGAGGGGGGATQSYAGKSAVGASTVPATRTGSARRSGSGPTARASRSAC